MHVNQQVRQEAASRLDGTSLVAVSTNQGWNLDPDRLPAAIIGTRTDRVERSSKPWDGHEELERREVELTVEVVADGEKETLDDDLDGLRAEIESAIGADDDFGGLAGMVVHTGGTLTMATDEEGDRWFAFLVLAWEIEVWTERGDPEVAV